MSSRGGVPLPPGSTKWNTHSKKPGSAAGANSSGGAPSSMKCAVCKKVKRKEDFSNRQLLKFSSYKQGGRTYNKDPSTVHVTCTSCTAGQTVELRCCVCDKVKGLDDFAKSQRKDPDNARCIKCVQADVDVEPDVPPESGSEAGSDDDEDEDGHVWDHNAMKSTTNKIKPYKPENKAAAWALPPKGDDDYDDYDEYEDDGFEDARSSSARSGRAQAAFNPPANQPSNKYTGRAAPADDDDDEWETMDSSRKPAGGSSGTASTVASSTYSSRPVLRKNGWAKDKKVKVDDENPWANYGKKDEKKDGKKNGKK